MKRIAHIPTHKSHGLGEGHLVWQIDPKETETVFHNSLSFKRVEPIILLSRTGDVLMIWYFPSLASFTVDIIPFANAYTTGWNDAVKKVAEQ